MVDDPRKQQEEREAREDPFTRSTRQFDNHVSALFNSLWSLPAAIYERGNEHGREFGRMMDERQRRYAQQRTVEDESRDEKKQEQEQEDARGKRACGWRGRHHHGWQRRQQEDSKRVEEEKEGAEAGEWLKRVAMEVEANAKEAERLYEDYEKKVLEPDMQGRKGVVAWWNEPFAEYDADELQKMVESRRAEATDVLGRALKDKAKHDKQWNEATERDTWTDLFPAWSAAQPHKHVDATAEPTDGQVKELAKHCPAMQNGRHGPIVATAQQVEDAIARANADWEALMKGTSQIAKAVQESYNRDARLWSQEGLFGPHVPFSGPLSTMFSMGMRPFMPQDSAMGYLLFSEYSPLHLEHEQGFDASFRRRFEELVRIQSGKPAVEKPEKEEGGKVEWLGRMSALLEENEARVGRKDDWETVWQQAATGHIEEPLSEMDVYERQLQKAASFQPPQSSQEATGTKPPTTHFPPAITNTEPSILSTLTTTERHVASDGTVTTKTVLKKRFADGREEVEDSTTTEQPQQRRRRDRLDKRKEFAEKFREEQKRREAELESNIAKEAKKSGGWFWSS